MHIPAGINRASCATFSLSSRPAAQMYQGQERWRTSQTKREMREEMDIEMDTENSWCFTARKTQENKREASRGGS